MQKALKRIESPKIKAILIVEVQRLSRGDLEDAGRLIKLLRYTNTIVITENRVFDLGDEDDREKFERELKRGNEFLEYQKKIMGRGTDLSVSQGNYLGSVPPYGYDKTSIIEGKRECPTLAINEEQAAVVQMIFDLYVNKNMGVHVICNHLDSLKIKPPKKEHWSPASVRDMLQNVHYIGKVKRNWRKTVTVVEDSEIIKIRPKAKMGEYLIYDGKHEAIITEELFNAAQEKTGKNPRVKPTTKIRNPLASLVYCQCGTAMTLRTYKKADGSERCAPRLLCNNRVHCQTGSCTYVELENALKDILIKCISDFEIHLKKENGQDVKMHEKLIKSLEKKLEDIEAKELAQWEAQANPDPSQRMPAEIFKKLNEKLTKEKAETIEALESARATMPNATVYEERVTRFREALEALDDPTISAQEKNRLLKACITRITYNRESPKRVTREPGEKHGTRMKAGATWTETPIEIDVKLKF